MEVPFLLRHWKAIIFGGVAVIAVIYHVWATNSAYDQGYKQAQSEVKDAVVQKERELNKKIAVIDANHTKEREKANAEISKLRADIASGAERLRVKVRCPLISPNGTSMGHAETSAELDPEIANSLISITSEGDEAIRQLTAAQEIIQAMQGQGNGGSR